MAEADAADAIARQDRDRRQGIVEALEHEIAAWEYDGESHVRLAQIEQKAIRHHHLVEELAARQRKRTVEETKLEASETAVRAAENLRAGVTAQLTDAETLRTSAKQVSSELKSHHGSADAVQHAAADLDSLRLAIGEIPKQREALACLEARATACRADYEAAQATVAEAQTDMESARANYEHWLARDRGAALRHLLKPGETCPVCEQTVHAAPTPLDARELAMARGRCDAAGTALQERCDHLAALRAEIDIFPGRIDLARRQCELLESTHESATGRAFHILGMTADGGAVGLLRALSEKIRTAESGVLEAQCSYERALRDERDASQALQDVHHNRKLILNQIASLDDGAVSLRKEMAVLEENLRGAPPLKEIAAQLKALHHAGEKRAGLEASRPERQNQLKQAEELAIRCAKDVEAMQNMQIKCATAIEELDLEIGRLCEQVHGPFGSFKALDSEDEAARIDSVRLAGQRDLEVVQARVQRRRMAIQSMDEKIARNQRLHEEIAWCKSREALYRDLAIWLNAGNFQQYLMGSAFERLAHEGSSHLKELSNGRYTFAYNDKEFQVIDQWNGDDARSVNTLSGGESFLASLSLALALAESLADLNLANGAVALESLFLDEGFSTLDAESQSRVADALQVLQGGKRLIGVITHVQALADQMPARIEIERTLSGSRVRQAVG